MNDKIVIGTIIGLVIGLALGIFVSIEINLPSSLHTGVGVNNQVQVSGTVKDYYGTLIENGTLYFDSVNKTIETSAPFTNGYYSVLLVAGQSYVVFDRYNNIQSNPVGDFNDFYIPLGVTAFTENLVGDF